jgi:uncharacterized membrane protein
VLSGVLLAVHIKTHLSPATDAFCSMGKSFDCAAVAASPSSIFLGVPWAVWGILGFGTLAFAALKKSAWLVPLSVVSALASVVLLGISLLHVGTLCALCEAAHLTSWLLCFFAIKYRSTLSGDLKDPQTALSILAGPAGFAVALVLFFPPYWGAFSYRAEPPFPTGTTEDGHPWIGSENPTFILEEFIDYNCPHCQVRSAGTLRKLAEHSDWRLIRRQQPRMRCRPGQNSACSAVRYAYCAQAQGKFWRADRWLFAHTKPGHEPNASEMAADLGLNEAELKRCVTSDQIYARAEAEAKAARKAKIIDVPGYLIDGKRYRAAELEEFLKKKD